MNNKKRFPNERPEDMNKVLTNLLSDIGFIRYLIKDIPDFRESPTVVYSINPKDFKNFLESIVKSLELLSGYITEELEPEIEALSGDLTSAYETNDKLNADKEKWRELYYEERDIHEKMDKEYTRLKEENKHLKESDDREEIRLKAENKYLRDDTFRIIMECTKRDKEITKLKSLLDTSIKSTEVWKKSFFNALAKQRELRGLIDKYEQETVRIYKDQKQNCEEYDRLVKEKEELRASLENSEKMLKAAVAKIDNLYNCIDDNEKNKELKNSLYGICAAINNGSNFCGNCRYCVQLMTGEYACRIPIPDRIIDPDDSSCQYFKQPYDTRTDQEVCAECDKKDTEHCKKCPLFPF